MHYQRPPKAKCAQNSTLDTSVCARVRGDEGYATLAKDTTTYKRTRPRRRVVTCTDVSTLFHSDHGGELVRPCKRQDFSAPAQRTRTLDAQHLRKISTKACVKTCAYVPTKIHREHSQMLGQENSIPHIAKFSNYMAAAQNTRPNSQDLRGSPGQGCLAAALACRISVQGRSAGRRYELNSPPQSWT